MNNEKEKNMDKNELIITALQQSLGEMASQDATKIALLRVEITQQQEKIDEYETLLKQRDAGEQVYIHEINTLKARTQELEGKIEVPKKIARKVSTKKL